MSTFFVSVNVSKKEEPKTSGSSQGAQTIANAPYYPAESININKEVEAQNEAEAVKSVIETLSKLG